MVAVGAVIVSPVTAVTVSPAAIVTDVPPLKAVVADEVRFPVVATSPDVFIAVNVLVPLAVVAKLPTCNGNVFLPDVASRAAVIDTESDGVVK
jgi:hypothetical protein